MILRSVNLGKPEAIRFREQVLLTCIHKRPVHGPHQIHAEGIFGDQQSDRRVHGGSEKAVYAMSTDCYNWWTKNHAADFSQFGILGENLSIEGLKEDEIYPGDIWEIGSCRLQITDPRYPCATLNAVLQDTGAIKKMLQSRTPGVYLRVLQSGQIQAGDSVKVTERAPRICNITEIFESMTTKKLAPEKIQALLNSVDLSAGLRRHLQRMQSAAQ